MAWDQRNIAPVLEETNTAILEHVAEIFHE
jgi:hypothetical protein